MQRLIQDLRYGIRILVKTPGFTIVAVFTLALGIGANTAIFSIVNSLLLNPLPYQNSERLAIIWTHSPGANVDLDWPSPGQFGAIKSQSSVFEDLAFARGNTVTVTGDSAPERVGAIRTAWNMFSVLGTEPRLGRGFLPQEDSAGQPSTVILSDGLWRRRFGGDEGAIGQSLTINGQPFEIVGVMPPDFALGFDVMPTVGSVSQADLFVPLAMTAENMNHHGDENYNVMARLKPGVTFEHAQADLDLAVRHLEQEFPDRYPSGRRFSLSIKSLHEQVVGDVRPALLVLLGAVGCVLLIACANVANLLLARAAVREREIAIRTAMGAGRGRVLRQLLTESLLLSALGGALGFLFATWALAGMRELKPGNIPRLTTISIDGRVLAFTSAVVLLTGILFGLAPALRSSRVNLSDSLKEGGRGLVGGHHRLRNLLVVAEIAVSLVLLVGAGLLIRSFVRVNQVKPGFIPDNVLSLRLALTGPSYREEARRLAFYQQLWDSIGQLPGVESTGGVSVLPLAGGIGWGSITIEGYDETLGQNVIQADGRIATVGYFETMKVPLISGRFFSDQDKKDAPLVAIVDDNMARTYWPNDEAVGKRFKRGRGANNDSPWMTVVGVVASVKQYALDTDSRVAYYNPHLQALTGGLYVTVRTTGDPTATAASITNTVRSLDPNVPVYDVKTMDQWVSESLARRRFAMLALGLFAAVAMILASIGIFGVMSYAVAQRTREIGIRMALGAQQREVLTLVVRHAMTLASIGVGLGLVGAVGVTRLMQTLLFRTPAIDLVTFGLVGVLLAGVALLACFVPAMRAAKVDPMVALRYE